MNSFGYYIHDFHPTPIAKKDEFYVHNITTFSLHEICSYKKF